MPTINELASTNTITGSDQFPVYVSGNGDARKASASTLLAYIQSAWMDPNYTRVTASPTLAGFTLALPSTANSLFVLLTPSGTMATGTIVLPPASGAADGQEIVLYTSQEVTALSFTLNGAAALNGAPSGIQAGAALTLRYDVLSTAWYTTTKPSSVGSGTPNYLSKWTAPTTLGDSIVRDNGTEVSIGGNVIAGQKLAVYGSQFNIVTDSDATLTVCNAASTAPRSATVEAANYTDGTTGTAGFRASIARGTLLVPAAVVSGDDLGAFISRAHDGTGFFEAGRIQFDAQSNWAAGRSSSITLSTCAGGIVGDRLYISPAGNVQLATNNTVFDAGGTGQGVRLSSTPGSADPNVLDAYDEGTFTPVYNGTGIVGTVTFAGAYQRVGNQITVYVTITTAAASTLTFTAASEWLDNFPAAITPPFDLVAGNALVDRVSFWIRKSGATFRAALQSMNPATPTVFIPASTSVRYTLATYLV
jgi:hypothetical protein